MLARLIGPRNLVFLTLILIYNQLSGGTPPSTTPVQGIRQNRPDIHALVGARLQRTPDEVIEQGTLIFRNGVIVAVGPSHTVDVPTEARIWDMSGKTIYPGLIDAYSLLPTRSSAAETTLDRGNHWNRQITPERQAAMMYQVDPTLNKTFRGQGITTRLVAPSAGLVRGTSCLVTTGDGPPGKNIVQDRLAQHVRLTVNPETKNRDRYPSSPMGALALVRQTFYDARWYVQAWEVASANDHLPRPEHSTALAALGDDLAMRLPVMFDADDERFLLRANQLAREFDLTAVVRGSGREYRRLEAVRATQLPVIIPVNFPRPPHVASPSASRKITLEELLDWDLAPENPARLDRAGVRIALSSYGLKKVDDFLPRVRTAVIRGLPPAAALRALTTTPAKILGVAHHLGTLDPGKSVHLVVTDGDLFEKKTRLLETWIDGQRYPTGAPYEVDVRGMWQLTMTQPDSSQRVFFLTLSGKLTELSGTIKQDGKTSAKLSHVRLKESQCTATFSGKPFGFRGVVRISATVMADGPAEWLGSVVWADGQRTPLIAKRISDDQEEDAGDDQPPDLTASKEKSTSDDKPETPQEALYEVNYPLGAFGRTAPPQQPNSLFFRNGTVWTCSSQGTLSSASVLIKSGKIVAVGQGLEPPQDAQVIDVFGKHITPGIIDCHSHIATDGGINETGQAITAEVRIGDFIDDSDINIYRQLAGGVTTANILHGSANPIGGQNQIIKMRWGNLPESLKFSSAPEGIKFALGENVKQSNWGDEYTKRYPQTRMGVEQIIRDAFNAAKQYRRQWENWQENHEGLPPRIDLELAALAEILEGDRLIHCHAYRQDEIVALMRTCEDFSVRIGTFQHALEGYKVATELVHHGAMASAFSDWWAYKFEVYDAIPYNGVLMHRAGVVVSFNSDDAELARRLNVEASKAVKYGQLPTEEALKFVTLNSARQLRIDSHVGSLEPGKDADLVMWSGPPLSTFSLCEQTWIEGRKYFDREEDLKRRAASREMRAGLVQRILSSPEKMLSAEDDKPTTPLWPREDTCCNHQHGDDQKP